MESSARGRSSTSLARSPKQTVFCGPLMQAGAARRCRSRPKPDAIWLGAFNYWRSENDVKRANGFGYVLSWMAVLTIAVLLFGCDSHSSNTSLRVFVADSLARPFGQLNIAFEAKNPGVEIVQISSGSVLAARKLTQANDRADVLAVADYNVMDRELRPAYANWSICFATNEVVIVYTDMSRGASEIASDNWFEILSRPEVHVQAANPFHDPCGYWTELCWKLSDLHYTSSSAGSIHEAMTAKCGPAKDRRSDSQKLLQLVETVGGVDYAFVYRSQAMQHNLSFLRLPPQIGLGDAGYIEFYRRAVIKLPLSNPRAGGRRAFEKRGDTIVFALTIPKTVRELSLAAKYVRFLLSPEGKAILSSQHLMVVDQPWTYDDLDRLPDGIRPYVVERSKPRSDEEGARSE